MKIIIFHSLYSPHRRGGAEVVVESIARGLVRRGHDVVVVTADRKYRRDEVDGVTVYRLSPANIFSFLDLVKWAVAARLIWHIIDMFNDLQSWRIHRILRHERPDVIMTHSLKGLSYQVPLLARALGIRHIHTVHDMQLLHPSGLLPTQASLPVKLYQLACRRLFASPAVVIFPSQHLKEIYEQHNFFAQSEKIVVGNPLSYSVLPVTTSVPHPFTVLYVGQIEEYKGVVQLIEAFRKIDRPARLWIVGDGSASGLAQKHATGDERIKFFGRLTHEQMEEQIWPETDVLVNPSLTPETFGLVIIEAYAHGVPVIAHHIGALPELIDQTTGWLVAPDRPDDLRLAIERLASGACRYEAYRLICYERAKQYNLERYLQELERFATIPKPQ